MSSCSMENISGSPPKKLKTSSSSEQKISHYSMGISLCNPPWSSLADQLLQIESRYSNLLSTLTFETPVAYVYDPIKYATNLHSQFIHKYCQSEKPILFLGMNPGPWGMSQTGVPFGEVSEVRDWLKLSGEVDKPVPENPYRPVKGLECHRSEVSGKRFWSALRETFGNAPEDVFKSCFVHNYCPLAFLTEKGTNVTPAVFKAHQKRELFQICDNLFVEVLRLLNVKGVIAIGRFAESQVNAVIKKAGLPTLKVAFIKHPSPRSGAFHVDDWRASVKTAVEELLVRTVKVPRDKSLCNMRPTSTDAPPDEQDNSGDMKSGCGTDKEKTAVKYAVGAFVNAEEGMECALQLAREALAVGEVPVGCVFTYEGQIIAIGRNTVNETRNATRHAEINCIDDVLKWCAVNKKESTSVLAATEVFVTVEPCIMCAGAIHNLHLKRISYGCRNDRFGGCGTVLDASLLAENPCEIVGGIRDEEAMQLLKDFYKGTNPNAPVPNVKKKTGRKDSATDLPSVPS